MPSGEIITATFDDFGNGIDRRVGLVTKAADKFYELSNYIITPGRRLQRRPPLVNLEGQLDAQTQGRTFINGKLVTLAPYGTTVAHGVVGIPVTTLFFDLPQNALPTWELVEMQTFNDQLVALIRHDFPSSAAPKRLFLHVWDDKRPTFVQDPACPTSWAPELPLHAYGEGKPGAYDGYTPRLAISNDRVYLVRPDGNVAFSGVGSPRIWNTRSAEEILVDGKWWYWITNDLPGDQTIIVDVPYEDLLLDKRYAAYVLERMTDSGEWLQFREQTLLSLNGDYRIESVTSPWDATKNATKFTYRMAGDGRVVRFRAMAKPPAAVQTGLYILPTADVVGGILTHDGQGHIVGSYALPTLAASQPYFIAVGVPGAPIPIASVAIGLPGSMPLNGQERYWSRILANAIADGTGANLLYQLTGTVTTTVGGTRVTGAGTAFVAELEIGRTVEINGERRTVRFVAGDTACEVDAPFSTAYTGVGLRDPRYRYASEVADTGNVWFTEREAEASLELAGKDDAGYLGTAMYDSNDELPIAIAALQNRLLVQFKSAVQLWQVSAQVLADTRLLSIDGQDAGISTRPQPAIVNNMVALPTVNGPRLFSPDGNNKDYIDFVGVGDLLRGYTLPDFTRAIWWPHLRALVMCAGQTDGDTTFFVLFSHQDTKVLAWSTFTFAGINRVDAMFISGVDLMIVQDNRVYRCAAEGATFRDTNDPADTPYLSRARWIYCTMGRPERNKRVVRCELVQEGKSTVAIYMNPRALDERTPGPPTASGTTFGLQRVPMAVMGPGLGLVVESRDPNGHQLDSIAFDYILLNR